MVSLPCSLCKSTLAARHAGIRPALTQGRYKWRHLAITKMMTRSLTSNNRNQRFDSARRFSPRVFLLSLLNSSLHSYNCLFTCVTRVCTAVKRGSHHKVPCLVRFLNFCKLGKSYKKFFFRIFYGKMSLCSTRIEYTNGCACVLFSG